MTKTLVQGLAGASAVMVLLTGAGINNLVEAVTQSDLARRGGSTQSGRILQVALPESATVRLTQGGSYSGNLTGFSSDNLTLSAGRQSITLAHSQIRQVEFSGTVWIPTPGGDVQLYRIRGLSQALENVPANALIWDGSSSLANLNLQGVLTQGEFSRLTRDSDLVYALIRVNFEPSNSNTMDVTVKSLALSQ